MLIASLFTNQAWFVKLGIARAGLIQLHRQIFFSSGIFNAGLLINDASGQVKDNLGQVLIPGYKTDYFRAYPKIKDWLFFPSRRSFLRGQMTTREEGRDIKKEDLGNFGCLLGNWCNP